MADWDAQAENEDFIEIRLQRRGLGGWFYGVESSVFDYIEKLRKERDEQRLIYVYRLDKWLIQQSWETEEGNFAPRGSLVIEVRNEFNPREALRRLWLQVVEYNEESIERYADQIDVVRNLGHDGCAMTWLAYRYLVTRASDRQRQKMPVNWLKMSPIMEVWSPNGDKEIAAVDTSDFPDLGDGVYRITDADIQVAFPSEQRLFDELLEVQVYKD